MSLHAPTIAADPLAGSPSESPNPGRPTSASAPSSPEPIPPVPIPPVPIPPVPISPELISPELIPPVPISFPALGTTAVLLVVDDRARDQALCVLEAEIAAMDRAASRFRPDGELVGLEASGEPVTVSALLFEAIEVALRGAALTGGRVDPTVGASMRAIGYDRDFGQISPDGSLRVTFRPAAGWRRVQTDPTSCSVVVPRGVVLDLGATAKALCADRAASAIYAETGSGTLVSLGGDVATAGTAPDGGWAVRVVGHHAFPGRGPGQTVVVRSGGLATSGTVARRWQSGGEALHHVVDPETGRPAVECWRTVTVAAGSCVDANIASTASVVLGAEAPQWLRRRGLPARLVTPAGDVTTVAGWPADGRP